MKTAKTDQPYAFRIRRASGKNVVVLTAATTELDAARRAVAAAGLSWPRQSMFPSEPPDGLARIVAVRRVGRFRPLARWLARIFRPRTYEAIAELQSGRIVEIEIIRL